MSERAPGEPIIDVRDLRRDFVVRRPAGRLRRDRHVVSAVDGITLAVRPGECVGYIGANGAGKSTTIKILTGVLVPTAGEVRVCGLQPVRQRRELARRIGVVFGQRSQLWWDLPLADSFRLLAAIHRLPDRVWRDRLAACADMLDLGGFLATPVRQLSLGQRMRGEVTAALLHSPELLVLDEPTIGLDIVSRERLRGFLADERRRSGTTVLLTTHDLPDIERLCDRILVVDHGRLVFDGDLAALAARVGAQRVLVVDLTEPAPPLDDVPGARLLGVEAGGLRQQLAIEAGATAAAVVAHVSARLPLRDLAVREPEIEDVVARLYSQPTARPDPPAADPPAAGRVTGAPAAGGSGPDAPPDESPGAPGRG
ncbi:MAG: viologen exporter family transport system ATP-binding protein [Mycobacteriales bacterium]